MLMFNNVFYAIGNKIYLCIFVYMGVGVGAEIFINLIEAFNLQRSQLKNKRSVIPKTSDRRVDPRKHYLWGKRVVMVRYVCPLMV